MYDARLYAGLALMGLITLTPIHANAQSPRHVDVDLPSEDQAFITQLGDTHKATVEQTNIQGGLLYGTILQDGLRNNATISLEGGDLSGSITQRGSDNQATLEIRDEQNRGAIEQYGDGNSAGLRIDGYGKDVTLIQEGNGHAYAGPLKIGGDAPAGQMITIRQY